MYNDLQTRKKRLKLSKKTWYEKISFWVAFA